MRRPTTTLAASPAAAAASRPAPAPADPPIRPAAALQSPSTLVHVRTKKSPTPPTAHYALRPLVAITPPRALVVKPRYQDRIMRDTARSPATHGCCPFAKLLNQRVYFPHFRCCLEKRDQLPPLRPKWGKGWIASGVRNATILMIGSLVVHHLNRHAPHHTHRRRYRAQPVMAPPARITLQRYQLPRGRRRPPSARVPHSSFLVPHSSSLIPKGDSIMRQEFLSLLCLAWTSGLPVEIPTVDKSENLTRLQTVMENGGAVTAYLPSIGVQIRVGIDREPLPPPPKKKLLKTRPTTHDPRPTVRCCGRTRWRRWQGCRTPNPTSWLWVGGTTRSYRKTELRRGSSAKWPRTSTISRPVAPHSSPSSSRRASPAMATSQVRAYSLLCLHYDACTTRRSMQPRA